jgi:UDP-glucose 4-epimerase
VNLEAYKGARVIVTGASGFIGFHLVKALSSLGADILVIDRNQPAEPLPGVEFEWADLRHLDKTYEADYLIHLAAITNAGYAERYPLDTYEVNVLGTVNLLNHVQVKNRILFPSTALIYKTSEIPLSEDAEKEASSTYAQSKMIGEQLVRFLCDRMGTSHTIVRFFNIFGPGQLSMYVVPQILRQILEEGRVVVRNGAVNRDLLYVEDLVKAVVELVVTPQAENSVFNIGSGFKVSIADMARTAVEISGLSGVEFTDLEQKIEFSPTAIVADISKVQSIIDWRPVTSLSEGLTRMWDYHSRPR